MAVILRDKEIEQRLEAKRRERFGATGGSLSRVLREMLREHFIRSDMSKPRRSQSTTAAK